MGEKVSDGASLRETALEDVIRFVDRELRICGLGGVREFADMVRRGELVNEVLSDE